MRSNADSDMERDVMMIKKSIDFIKLWRMLHLIRKQQLKIDDIKRWRKAFFYYLCNMKNTSSDYINRWNVIKGFTKCNMKILKRAQNVMGTEDPILICVVLNEIERMGVFLNHYRKIGIKKFAIIDNGSTDGTIKFLKGQSDVELFQTRDRFESRIKMGWINRVISYYGTDHWFLVVDADELLVWHDVESMDLQCIIKYLDKMKVTRARALMVDMYPKQSTWNSNKSFEEIYHQCKYFDHSTYFHKKTEEVYLLCGGPRKRMLGIDLWLTKYPLFRLKEKDILSNPHSIYPYTNKKTPCYFALLHYKFLTQKDQVKMKKYAKKGNYAGGSSEYKKYIQMQEKAAESFDFYYKNSVEYKSSESLGSIQEIDKIPMKRFS